MDYLFLAFASLLGLGGLGFVGVFIYRLMQTPEAGPKLRTFNQIFLVLMGLVVLSGLGLALFGSNNLSDWGQVQAAGGLALALWVLAAEGFGIGFKQMEDDGVGYLRFFQLGSSIVLCFSLAPAFYAFVTYASRFSG
jgi:hypothetical protein